MIVKSNECGICPFCNKIALNYGVMELMDNMCYYPWTCENCGHRGEEWYEMSFAGHNVVDEDGDEIEITEDMIESEEF